MKNCILPSYFDMILSNLSVHAKCSFKFAQNLEFFRQTIAALNKKVEHITNHTTLVYKSQMGHQLMIVTQEKNENIKEAIFGWLLDAKKLAKRGVYTKPMNVRHVSSI